ncbi:MAG: ferredoxin [Firmicutes bacterium ADurb.Bin419]|nr:MAG: ferredoxin [Firmicutes bacterium ADurb.Bin419]
MRRIGVFLCCCGSNISEMVDIDSVVNAVNKHKEVAVVEQNLHFCSQEGQDVIKEKVKKYDLDGVVIAACSPKLHEKTFKNVLKSSGLNPYLFEIANIREQVSWCSEDRDLATKKAAELVYMKVKKVSRLIPLEEGKLLVVKKALVIGAGIAGIEAALDIANQGVPVIMLEKSSAIGGNMAKLDKTFPTLDCSACILAPKMFEAFSHPLISVYCSSTIKKVSGSVGNFTVTIEQQPRYVDTKKCSGCGKCIEKCPVRVNSEFDEGISIRSAIYKAFPEALPKAPIIDKEACLYFKSNKCGNCSRVCQEGAINYEDSVRIIEEQVGAIITATGYDLFDAGKYTEYGYGYEADVISGLQFERLINSSGPTNGKIARPSDGKTPKTIVFVHCTGSRDPQKGMAYCSKICCMATAKHAAIAKMKIPDADIYSFYIDIRAGGKNYDEFIRKAAEGGIKFIKGRVSRIVKDGDKLVVKAENILLGKPVSIKADLVILATAMVPDNGAIELARILGIEYDQYGFFTELHPKLNPVSTSRAGIFLAGSCRGPMDVSDTVSHAGASAEKALEILSKEFIIKEPVTATINTQKCTGCFACRKLCYYGAIEEEWVNNRKKARVNSSVCQGCGNCASQCQSGAANINNMTDLQLYEEIIGALI